MGKEGAGLAWRAARTKRTLVDNGAASMLMADMDAEPPRPAKPRGPPHSNGLRIVPRSQAERIRRVGLRTSWRSDLYHRTLTLRWWQFLVLGCALYLLINVLFAGLYLLQPGSIQGAEPGRRVTDAFFFSVQTIATIGYGQMSPATLYANILVTLETMAGLIFIALAAGVVFARISRPTARVLFGASAVVGRINGVPTLSLRLANERRSQILEADVAVSLLRYEQTAEGVSFRRFHDLRLVRRRTPVFALTFTVMHVIDDSSPLHGATLESLVDGEAELLITVTGLEETTSQTVHARWSYGPKEILWDRRLADIFVRDAAGRRQIDYRRFHDTEVEPAER